MQIRAYATLRDLLGGSVFEQEIAPGATVGDVLADLAQRHAEFAHKLWRADGRPTGLITVLLNGRSIEFLQGNATPVGPGDILSLFPPVGGG